MFSFITGFGSLTLTVIFSSIPLDALTVTVVSPTANPVNILPSTFNIFSSKTS